MASVATGAVGCYEISVFNGETMVALPIGGIASRSDAEALREPRVLMAVPASLRKIAHEDAGARVGLREDRVSLVTISAAGSLTDPLGAGLPVHTLIVLLDLVRVTACTRLSCYSSGRRLMRNALHVAVTDNARKILMSRTFKCRAIYNMRVAIPAVCGLLCDSRHSSQHKQYPIEGY